MIQDAKKHRKRNKTLIKQIGSSKGAYTERKRALRILGFRTYKDYLASDLWQSIRLRVLDRDGGLCRGCGKRATQVHHTNYNLRTMDGRNIQPLWSVCRWCHKGGEFLGSSKTTIGQANLRITRRPQ